MRKLDGGKIIIYLVSIVACVVAARFIEKFPRTRGKNLIFHGAFVVSAILLVLLVPNAIQNEIFSPGGVVVIGTVLPVYSSIVAVCTPGEQDDSAWLQYWIASGAFNYATEFVDEIKHVFPNGGEHWYEFELFVTLWLMLPFTDGAALMYDYITVPYIAPTAKKIKSKVEGWISVILTVVNTSYLSFAWWIFMLFPENQRRFFVVLMGTVSESKLSVL
jgi:TB2/DP1, HVA22 family